MTDRERLLQRLMLKMIEFDAGDARRIQHFVKVHSFARTIGLGEGATDPELLTLEAAAIVHDIGIHPAEEKYGRCDGKLQEQEGAEPARRLLEAAGFSSSVVERAVWLVAHHHTYRAIEGLDYRALVEADFLVNLFEDAASDSAVRAARTSVFRTASGVRLLDTMFGLDGTESAPDA